MNERAEGKRGGAGEWSEERREGVWERGREGEEVSHKKGGGKG